MLNLMGAIPVLLKQQSKYCKYCKSEYVPVRQGTWYSSLQSAEKKGVIAHHYGTSTPPRTPGQEAAPMRFQLPRHLSIYVWALLCARLPGWKV